MLYGYSFQTGLGLMSATSDGTNLKELYFSRERGEATQDGVPDILYETERQVLEYFSGVRQVFDLPLAPQGTPFQREVWAALQRIPYGRTATYGAVAKEIGNPKASRAVGMANNKNPIGIIIPCHRVIGADGSLVGYASGLDKKAFLLKMEAGSPL